MVGACLAPFICSPATAEEPVEGKLVSFVNANYLWQLDRTAALILSVVDRHSNATVGQYDISDCTFCEGESDNCDEDGIVEINPISRPSEPFLGVVCHIGAHSQQLQIFAPKDNQTDAIFTLTGAYYVQVEPTVNGVAITYDQRGADGQYILKQQNWP